MPCAEVLKLTMAIVVSFFVRGNREINAMQNIYYGSSLARQECLRDKNSYEKKCHRMSLKTTACIPHFAAESIFSFKLKSVLFSSPIPPPIPSQQNKVVISIFGKLR